MKAEMNYDGVRLGTVEIVDAKNGTKLFRDVSEEEYDKIMKCFNEKEFAAYVNHLIGNGKINRKDGAYVTGILNVQIDTEGYVELEFKADDVRFQRIRRITGYLVGTIDRFNDAKRHEVEDRVKHSTSYFER